MQKMCAAGFHPASRFSIGLLLAALSWAGQTKNWQQSDYSDFEKGTIKNLSLRSDGLLTLAPHFREAFDSASAYLWALAHDSAGNLYAGGGPDAKLYRITPNGEKKKLGEFEGLEVHAIAVDRKDQVFVATDPDGKVYKVSSAGKSELFYDPKTVMLFGHAKDSLQRLIGEVKTAA